MKRVFCLFLLNFIITKPYSFKKEKKKPILIQQKDFYNLCLNIEIFFSISKGRFLMKKNLDWWRITFYLYYLNIYKNNKNNN